MADDATGVIHTEIVRGEQRPASGSGITFSHWYIHENDVQEPVPGVLLSIDHEQDAYESRAFMPPAVALQVAGQMVLAVHDGLIARDKCIVDTATRQEIAAELELLKMFVAMVEEQLPAAQPAT